MPTTISRSHAEPLQVVRQLVRARVQLPVGQLFLSERHRDSVGGPLDLILEKVVNRTVDLKKLPSGVPLLDQLMPFGWGQELKARDALPRSRETIAEKSLEVPNHPSDGALLEQVRGVLERSGESILTFLQRQGQVECSARCVTIVDDDLEIGEDNLRNGSVLQHEHDLEDRCVGTIAKRRERFHQAFEGKILMRVCGEATLSRSLQQLAKRGIAGEIPAHDERVHEKPDDAFELRPASVRDRSSNEQIRVAAVPVQQYLKGRQQRHEDRHIFMATECADVVKEPARPVEAVQ